MKKQAQRIARIVARAIDWKRETTDVRCGQCGTRIGRRAAEIALYEAVAAYEATLRTTAFDSAESPTVPRGRRK